MGRPLFLEGEAGVGKTELAKVLAAMLGAPLIRLQCYEGLDMAASVYEWNVARQMTAIRLAEARGQVNDIEAGIYGPAYLIRRPILEAIELARNGTPPVLLIDELDRADEPFEAFLLEVLSDFQVTIPEWGTIKATVPPVVVITSNRTREIHDAVKRRCLYHWVEYPDAEREWQIVNAKAPDVAADLSRAVVAYVQRLRQLDLYKPPGVAETIDWARALTALNTLSLDPQSIESTLGVLLKYHDDILQMRGEKAAALLAAVNESA
ncbi:MAG: MoxR family ATPase [Betaproteobacteria bacterium]|nr:MoxR family ATPase [Betaproteobacteria bacterium]